MTRSELLAHAPGPSAIANEPPAARAAHPRGLIYLVLTEGWERFSYYGMVALISLYMVGYLLVPGRIAGVVGLGPLREVLEGISGPLSTQALASQLFGLYSGLVYFTPVLGGLIADRWIGQRNAVVLGIIAMSAGHAVMTSDRLFLLALLLLIVGSGFLKGNISAQVGSLYARDDDDGRVRGYTFFQTAINIGGIIGPLLCGWLAQAYGWHYGFGIAAILMLVALATYLAGYRHLPRPVKAQTTEARPMTPAERRTVLALLAVMSMTIFQTVASYQVYNVMPVWLQREVALDVGGFAVPPAWYQSMWALTCITGVPPVLWWWRRQAERGHASDDLSKIRDGAWITAASNLLLVLGIVTAGDGPVSQVWPLLYVTGLGVSFILYWPTLMALVSRAAPARLASTLMGVVMLTMFVANMTVGVIGGWYERMTPAAFWGVHASIAAVGGVLIVLFGRRLATALHASP